MDTQLIGTDIQLIKTPQGVDSSRSYREEKTTPNAKKQLSNQITSTYKLLIADELGLLVSLVWPLVSYLERLH